MVPSFYEVSLEGLRSLEAENFSGVLGFFAGKFSIHEDSEAGSVSKVCLYLIEEIHGVKHDYYL